ncbi:MAG: hypothetical protein K9L30_18190 [Desulfobacterales bacterium]|nr:hypothetical protein [Desulfobacterales bacterium]
MKVVLFGNVTVEPGKHLWHLIKDLIPKGKIESCQTIDSLEKELCQYKAESTVAVLLCSSKRDLTNLVASRFLFDDIPIILVLPDRKAKTVSEGHKLYPRYLTL